MNSSQVTQPPPMRIVFAKGTDIGRQWDHNEDYVDAFSPPDPAQRGQKGELFIVADGSGWRGLIRQRRLRTYWQGC
jgi:serine/threonine protein phosphatase PrpC